MTSTATGNAFDAALNAGSTGAMNLSLGTFKLASTAGAGVNLDGTGGTGKLNVVTLTNGTITKAATGGFLANKVTFDGNLTTAGIQQVTTVLNIGISTDTTQIKGDGLRLIDPTGTLLASALNVFNDTGTGVLVNTKGGGTTFTLNTSSGQIKTTNGAAMSLDPLTIAMTLNSVESDNSLAHGILMDTVSGTLTIGATTLNDSITKAILIQNTPAALTAKFGTTNIHSTIGPLQSDNVDLTTGNGTNVTISFSPLTITGP